MRLPALVQPSAQPEQHFELPDDGKPQKLSFQQCLMVAKQHMLGGQSAEALAATYGYTTVGMQELLQGPYMQALMQQLFKEWKSGAEQAVALADAAAPVIMRRVIQRALPHDQNGDDEWEAQKFVLTSTLPRRNDPDSAASTRPLTADPVVVNNLFVGLKQFQQLIQAGPAGPTSELSERLLHGTEGIDLAEVAASNQGQQASAPTTTPDGAVGADHAQPSL